ncbi:hypothetical protein SB775_32985, partial [Peribacillus sp. SIMBA_075]
LTFYIIMGFFLYLGLSKRIAVVSILWLAVSVAIMVISNIANHRLTTFIEYLSISNYSHLFIAGIMFYLVRQKGQVKYHLI